MKTTIKSFIIICSLGLIGLSNANAADSCKFKNSEVTNSGQILAEFNGKIASLETEINGSIDYQKEAQRITKWIADMAEAKATQQIMERNANCGGESATTLESNDEITDFRKEAQLVTKAMADKAEASAIQKLVDEGKIAENR